MKLPALAIAILLANPPLMAAVETEAKPILHRAFEPAAATIDLSMDNKSLSLFFNLPAIAISHVSRGNNHAQLLESLRTAKRLAKPDSRAECQLISQRFFQQSDTANTDEFSNTDVSSPEIHGYLHYQCQKPEHLKTVELYFMDAIPGLLEINAWVSSEYWQDKQMLSTSKPHIKLQNQVEMDGKMGR